MTEFEPIIPNPIQQHMPAKCMKCGDTGRIEHDGPPEWRSYSACECEAGRRLLKEVTK